jgi:glycosyltransferase involved in cell wall biosynthesis
LEKKRMRHAAAKLRARGVRQLILYVWRPAFARAVQVVDYDYSCYHIDDEYSFSPEEKPNDPLEMQLITDVDQVIIHSPALLDKKGTSNSNTHLIPNGVDYVAFSTAEAEPEDLRSIPHPRIGYVGIIKEQLDLELISLLAKRHPNWQFVFVGPIHQNTIKNIPPLRELPNLHFPGARKPDALPAYVQHMDVNLLPYVDDGYTKFIYPLKLHEYLAAGPPVVGTPIRSLQSFAGVIQLASTVDEWSAAITEALDPKQNSPAAVAARQAVARDHDWNVIVERIALTFRKGLEKNGK